MEIEVDSRIYSKDVVLAAAYSILDKAHVIIRKNMETKAFDVTLISRTEDIIGLDLLFHDLLINYATYYQKASENAELKKIFIATSLYALKDE